MEEQDFMFKPDFLDFELNKTDRTEIVKEEVCILCYTDKPDVLFFPCQHQACCSDCMSKEPLDNCPICKQNIMMKKTVALPNLNEEE